MSNKVADWRKRISNVGPEVHKLAGSLVRANASSKYSKSVVKRRRSFHAKNRSLKQDSEDELRRLRLLCKLQEEERKEKQALVEQLQEENEDLKQDNELLGDRLRFAQEELEVLRFLHTTTASSDEYEAIGPLSPSLVEESGTRAGDYQLEGLLGKGSFGRVWSARSTKAPHQEVAIKEFDKRRIQSTTLLSTINVECGILRTHGNHHPNLVGFGEVLHGRQSIFLVMEKSGDSLVAYSGHHTFQPDFPQQVMIGVLRALAYLHQHGISHRDIDPQNILIQRSDSRSNYIGADAVRLCDFGLAHVPDQEEGDFVAGKPGYLAPEIVTRPKERHDYRQTDLWSLGCTLLAMTNRLTSRWFEYYAARHSNPSGFGVNLANYVQDMRNRGPASSSQVDVLEFDFLVGGLLQMDPAQRLSSEAALAHPWLQLDYSKQTAQP